MTKQQHSATNLPPSRLCRLLLLACALKLTVLGLLICDPALPESLRSLPGVSLLFQDAKDSGPASAHAAIAEAATPPGAGAPPALGVNVPSPAGLPSPHSDTSMMDQTVPGISSTLRSDQTPEPRVLPAIGTPGAAVSAEGDAAARDLMARRQEDLSRKEQDLRVLESELNNRLEQMKILENRLSSMIKDAEDTTDAKFRHLVDVLSNMKAKQAAAVLETLDPKIAVKVLSGMRGRQAGEVLTYVRPEIAAQLTESLARMQLPLE